MYIHFTCNHIIKKLKKIILRSESIIKLRKIGIPICVIERNSLKKKRSWYILIYISPFREAVSIVLFSQADCMGNVHKYSSVVVFFSSKGFLFQSKNIFYCT